MTISVCINYSAYCIVLTWGLWICDCGHLPLHFNDKLGRSVLLPNNYTFFYQSSWYIEHNKIGSLMISVL